MMFLTKYILASHHNYPLPLLPPGYIWTLTNLYIWATWAMLFIKLETKTNGASTGKSHLSMTLWVIQSPKETNKSLYLCKITSKLHETKKIKLMRNQFLRLSMLTIYSYKPFRCFFNSKYRKLTSNDFYSTVISDWVVAYILVSIALKPSQLGPTC